MKSMVYFARGLFYGINRIDGEDRVNREFKEIREIREGATLDRVDRVYEARVS